MIVAPLAGAVHELAYADDPAFAMLGAGVAITPVGALARVCAPVQGTLVSVHPHAFAIDDGEGGVLVHLGINSYRHVDAFDVFKHAGELVHPGDPVIEWNIDATRTAGFDPIVVVVAMRRAAVTPTEAHGVELGDFLFSV